MTEILDRFKENKDRVIDILASNSMAMGVLLRIVDIRPDSSVKTAELINVGAPMILYNPEFVNKHCENEFHMAALLLHEIYHVLLGHLLRGQPTAAENYAMDAIINAMICLQYSSRSFHEFFENYYSRTEMPTCFLRPRARPKRFTHRRKYTQLYTALGLPQTDLEEAFKDIDEEESVGLLGNHSGIEGNALPDQVLDNLASAVQKDLSKKIQDVYQQQVNKLYNKRKKAQSKYQKEYWHGDKTKAAEDYKQVRKIDEEIYKLQHAGLGISSFHSLLEKRKEISKKKKELEEALRKVAKQSIHSKLEFLIRGQFPKIPETSVVPNYRNRRALVSLITGQYNPFFKNPMRPRDFGLVTVYIDVSGSMNGFLSTVYKLCCNCQDYIDETIYLFSNDVKEITKEELLKGVRKSTYGTDDCFLDHALANSKRKIMVFTDGWLSVKPDNVKQVKKTGTKILVAYTPQHSQLPKEITHAELVMDKSGEAKQRKRW